LSYGRGYSFFDRIKSFFGYLPDRIGEIVEEGKRHQIIFTTRDLREIYRTSPLTALIVFCLVNLLAPGLVVFAILAGLIAGVRIRVRTLY